MVASSYWVFWVVPGSMEFIIPGCKPDPPLRVAGRRVNLTYAALFPGELTFDILLAACRRWAANRGGLREYACGREQHPDPADALRAEHFHLYVEFGKVVDISDRRHTIVFDLPGLNGRLLHPELQQVGRTAGDRQRLINYNIKGGEYVSELHTALAEDALRNAADTAGSESADEADEAPSGPSWARMLSQVSSVAEGMELLALRAPEGRGVLSERQPYRADAL